MLKPITVMELLKLFMKNDVKMTDIVMIASDEGGNSFGHLQPELYFDELKNGDRVVVLYPYADGLYEDHFKEGEYRVKNN